MSTLATDTDALIDFLSDCQLSWIYDRHADQMIDPETFTAGLGDLFVMLADRVDILQAANRKLDYLRSTAESIATANESTISVLTGELDEAYRLLDDATRTLEDVLAARRPPPVAIAPTLLAQ